MPHNPIPGTITVEPITPAQTVVVCNSGFLHTLAEVEREIAHLEITDGPTAQAAATIQGRLTKAGQALEVARTTAKAPFLAKSREIDELAKAPAGRIDAAKRGVSQKLVAYADAQRKAEAARIEELRKLEAAKKVEVVDDLNLDGSPTEQRIAEISQPTATAPAGIAYRVTLFPFVEDISKLPPGLTIVTANMQAIRAAHCQTWKEGMAVPVVPGVRFEIQRAAISTGKAGF